MLFPKRIVDYATEISHERAGEITRASIRCACGSKDFQLFYKGKLAKGLFRSNLIMCDDGLLTLAAVCCKCQMRIELFDSRTDGYSAKVEETPKDRNWIQKEKMYLCRKCGSRAFQVCFRVEYSGMEELDDFPDPEDCYSWIRIDVVCSNCKTVIHGLIDMETA